MRSVTTEISSTLFGLSVLIFIFALLIPLLRGVSSSNENGGTAAHELTSSRDKTTEGMEPEHTQRPTIEDGLQAPITPHQSDGKQNQSDGLTEPPPPSDASSLSSRDTANETANVRAQSESSSTQSAHTSAEPTSLLVIGGDFFLSGQATPSANVQKAIDNIIPLIKKRSLDKVVVEGHADKRIASGLSPDQTSKLNEIISLQRANAIALMLVQKGITYDRIIVHGLGDTVPLASNLTQEGRAQNRRVEIKLLPVQQ